MCEVDKCACVFVISFSFVNFISQKMHASKFSRNICGSKSDVKLKVIKTFFSCLFSSRFFHSLFLSWSLSQQRYCRYHVILSFRISRFFFIYFHSFWWGNVKTSNRIVVCFNDKFFGSPSASIKIRRRKHKPTHTEATQWHGICSSTLRRKLRQKSVYRIAFALSFSRLDTANMKSSWIN